MKGTLQRDVEKSIPAVLLVEREPGLIYLVRRYTDEMGYRLVVAGPGDETVEMARLERPAAIVLDLATIETDAGEMLETLRTDRATQDIPLVLCSWLERAPQDRPDGIAAYLRKPVSFQAFDQALAGVEQAGRPLPGDNGGGEAGK